MITSRSDLGAAVLCGAELCRRWYEGRMWRRARAVAAALGHAASEASSSSTSSGTNSVTRKGSFRVAGGLDEAEFWSVKGLPKGDWIGLTAHLLSEIFSEEILCFLEEDDTRFQLGVRFFTNLN